MQYARLLCILLLFKMLSFKVKSGKAVSLYSETLACTGVYNFRRCLIVNNLAACYIPGITPFDYHRSAIVMVLFFARGYKNQSSRQAFAHPQFPLAALSLIAGFTDFVLNSPDRGLYDTHSGNVYAAEAL